MPSAVRIKVVHKTEGRLGMSRQLMATNHRGTRGGSSMCFRIAVTAMSCGQTPRRRHAGPLRTVWGLSSVKRRGGCRAGLPGIHAATGKTPGIHDASEPWRVALQAGPGTLTPWPCGRTATLASAARRNRTRGPYRTTDTPQPPHGTASAKASRALSRALGSRLRPSRASEATDRPLQLSYPTPAPGPRHATPGCGRSCFGFGAKRWVAPTSASQRRIDKMELPDDAGHVDPSAVRIRD